jgi:hypothetical protein
MLSAFILAYLSTDLINDYVFFCEIINIFVYLASLRDMRDANQILDRKPEEKRPLARPRYKWRG